MSNKAPAWITEELSKLLNQAIYEAQQTQEDSE